MAEVEWIKLDTNVFDSTKVKYLRRTDHGVEFAYIWVYLLTLAGKTNDGGKIAITDGVPFHQYDLALEMGIQLDVFESAVVLMKQLKMIREEEDYLIVCGWEDHQSADKLEEIREKNRERKARYDAKKKGNVTSNVTSNVTVTSRNALDKDKDKEKEEELEKDKDKGITEEKAKPSPPPRHKYGEFQHVLLTDSDLEKLKTEFTDWEERIQRLDEYIEMKGENYKNHYLTIKNWARRDSERGYSGKSAAGNQGKTGTDEGRVFGILI